MKNIFLQLATRLKEFVFSSKEIILIFFCFAVFFISLITIQNRINTNVDVQDKLAKYSEQLQPEPGQKAFEPESDTPRRARYFLSTSKGMFYHTVPPFLVWIFLISAFMAISTGLVFPYIFTIIKTVNHSKISAYYLSGVILCIVVIGIITLKVMHAKTGSFSNVLELKAAADLLQEFDILLKNPDKTIGTVVQVLFFVSFIGVAGLLLLNKAIANISTKPASILGSMQQITCNINRLKEDLRFYLYSLSLLVVGSIITTGMLRESILTILPRTNDFFFPIEFVYLYGLSFTLILAFAYFPIFYNLKNKRKALIAGLEPLSNNFKDGELKAIKKEILIENTAYDNMKIIFSIMVPLITSRDAQIGHLYVLN